MVGPQMGRIASPEWKSPKCYAPPRCKLSGQEAIKRRRSCWLQVINTTGNSSNSIALRHLQWAMHIPP